MPKKTAAIATYHKSWNYGACLQAYASLVVFEKLGFDASLINYTNVDEEPKTTFDYLASGSLKEAISTAIKNIGFGCRRNALAAFDSFHDELKRTRPIKDVKELLGLQADILVAGSDQIWNPEISGGKLDPVFILDITTASKKISFASSAGSHRFTAQERREFGRVLADYDAVSVREDYLGAQIDEVTDYKPFKCLDPTLMLSFEQWSLEEEMPRGIKEGEKYILAFTLKSNDKAGADYWKRLSADMGLPVWRVTNNSYKEKGVDRQLLGMTPREFLWLVHHASYVVTDSFHGTAFSINYSTPFSTLPSKSGNNARMLDLLECCGLVDRFVSDAKYCRMDDCDFNQASNYLTAKRAECFVWLESVSIAK